MPEVTTLREFLLQAAEEERRSEALYRRGAALIKDSEAHQFLLDLAAEELVHEREILAVLARGGPELDIELPPDVAEAIGGSIHGADTEVAATDDATIGDVLLLALKRENRAREVYERAAACCDESSELRDFFVRIAQSEDGHYRGIRRHYLAVVEEQGG